MRVSELFEESSGYYYEQLAAKLPAGLKSDDAILDAAFEIAVKDLGKKRAQYYFRYDEDFPSDVVTAYNHLQKKSVKEDWGSSDWYPVMQSMKKYVEQGMSPEEAAKECADRWYQDMGWDEPEQAEMNILARFKRLVMNPPKHEPKPTDNPAYVKEAWKVVIKNKDGKEKRFPSGKENSPEAIAWKNSSSKKSTVKLAAYSDAYWEKKEMESDDPSFKAPWDPIGPDDTDEIAKIVKDHFSMETVDWEMLKKGETKRDGTSCATRVIRVMYEIGPEDDMGVDHRVQDAQNIIVARNPKKPKQIDFLAYGH